MYAQHVALKLIKPLLTTLAVLSTEINLTTVKGCFIAILVQFIQSSSSTVALRYGGKRRFLLEDSGKRSKVTY